MKQLRVIRQEEATAIERIWNPNKDNTDLTSKYVLFNSSLGCFKKVGIRIDKVFKTSLKTRNEYCLKYKDYYLVNDYLMRLEQSREGQDEVIVRLVDKEDLHTIRCVSVNKYVLNAYANLYGHGVYNSIYLAAFKLIYQFDREIESVYSYEVITTDGYNLIYVPHSKFVYDDGSVETYRGVQVVDRYKASNFFNKLEVNGYYCKDLLEGNTYKRIGGEIPFDFV